jgi:hypothetical protein
MVEPQREVEACVTCIVSGFNSACLSQPEILYPSTATGAQQTGLFCPFLTFLCASGLKINDIFTCAYAFITVLSQSPDTPSDHIARSIQLLPSDWVRLSPRLPNNHLWAVLDPQISKNCKGFRLRQRRVLDCSKTIWRLLAFGSLAGTQGVPGRRVSGILFRRLCSDVLPPQCNDSCWQLEFQMKSW